MEKTLTSDERQEMVKIRGRNKLLSKTILASGILFGGYASIQRDGISTTWTTLSKMLGTILETWNRLPW